MAAAGAGFDFNQLAQTMGLGKQQTDDGSGANEKDIFDMVVDAAGGALTSPLKALKINAKELPSTGITRNFEPPDITSSNINKAAENLSAKGGFVYRTFIAPLMKRAWEGVGGNAHNSEGGGGEGGGGFADSGGGGGGGDGGGGGFADSGGGNSMADFGGGAPIGQGGDVMTVDYGGHRYEVANMPTEIVGTLSPPNVGAIGVSIDKGDMGIG